MKRSFTLVTLAWISGLSMFSLVGDLAGQVSQWKTFTSVGTIKQMVVSDDLVWAGSDGGVLTLNISQNEIAKITNTDGLTSNDVVAVAIDPSGAIWFAFFNGILNRFFPDTGKFEVIEDYRDQSVSDIIVFGDSLYVGLDIGVSLYTIDKKEVKETYQNLGLSSGGGVEKIGANSVFIDGTDIWVTTDKGIALSSLDLPNLQAPSSWSQFTTTEGLRNQVVNDLVVLGNTAYAATKSGISRQRSGIWENAGLSGVNVRQLKLAAANQLFTETTVLAITSAGVFWLDTSDTWQRLGPSLNDVTAMATNNAGNVWIGRRNKGIAQFDFGNNSWELTTANGPASNDFTDLLIDSKGRLWCASAQVSGISGGVFLYDGNTWTNLSRDTGLPSNDYRALVEDAQGRIWAGSWGGGISILEENSTGFSVTVIDTADGLLAGFIGDPDFVLINGLTRDQDDNIWILNRDAINTRVLIAHTPNDEWVHFSTNPAGLSSRLISNIEVDLAGRIWVGTENRGISVLDYGESLLDQNDDDFTQGLTTSDGLFANEITAMAEDQDGVFWIGTNVGLNLYFNQESLDEFNLISNSITAIGVDGRNNKWIGTINGITVLRGHLDKIADFTTGNSPLVSGNIQSFAFDSETGEAWIGTDKGLSRAQTFFTAPREDLSQLTGFPNPFIIDGRRVFTITNLSKNTSVNIYNSAGTLIREFESSNDIQGAQAFWDGKDQGGKLVASGVYVYLAHTDNDISASGKVAVVRR